MKEYLINKFGIWEKTKHIGTHLDELGFFNSYKGVNDVRRLVLRTREYNDTAIDLTFKAYESLLDDNVKVFKKLLVRVNGLVLRAESMYNKLSDNAKLYGIELKEGKYYIADQDNITENELPILVGLNKIIVELQSSLTEDTRKYTMPRIKSTTEIVLNPELSPRGGISPKRYGTDEDEFIKANYTTLPLCQLAKQLGRTPGSVKNHIAILKKKGEI